MARESGRLGQILTVLRKEKIVYGITPEKLRRTLEELGPTFVKFGQIFSMRTDLLPQEYTRELSKLRTSVRPMEFSVVWAELKSQLGKEPEEVFASIDPAPLGSASIAQVHRAVLKSGEHVVIKIQRPNIRSVMYEDIQLLKKAAGILGVIQLTENINLSQVLDELWKTTKEELDFSSELKHILAFREKNKGIAYVAFPEVYPEYSNASVLVMEEIRGYSVSDKKALVRAGYDLQDIGVKLAQNYIKQVLEDGYFHADPHQGNMLIRGDKIVWLDLGMVGTVDEASKALFKRAAKAILLNDIEDIMSVILAIGKPLKPVNRSLLYNDVDNFLAKYLHMGLGSIDVAVLLEEFLGIAETHGIVIPSTYTMLARGVATIEGVVLDLCPDVNFMELIGEKTKKWIVEDFDARETLQRYGISLYHSLEKTAVIPGQVSDVLRMVSKGQLRTSSEVKLSERNMSEAGGMADKIAFALTFGGLFVGSCLLCMADVEPRAGGIPVVAWVGFSLTFVYVLYQFAKKVFRKLKKRKK